jgi:hypoxanthine phosphoribosyltransferase
MATKTFTTTSKLQLDSIRLGEKIVKDNFKPDFLVAIFRGGVTPGCYVHELLNYVYEGHEVDHIAIRTSRYVNPTTTLKEVQVHNLGYLVERLNSESKVIIIDDVFDSGLSIKAVLDNLKLKLRKNMPEDIRIATVDYKPSNNKTTIVPDYYVNIYDAEDWLVYPHELEGLTNQEISDNISPEIATIVQSSVDHYASVNKK